MLKMSITKVRCTLAQLETAVLMYFSPWRIHALEEVCEASSAAYQVFSLFTEELDTEERFSRGLFFYLLTHHP